ncbi:DEP domain-containing protein 7 isoform X2 [Brienomyrus brachyistius]|uniref:DEP domain-containing protein 7 isoform X2 n=1 Tax=Brienomyrus brachyistius TaxID=42636 RepID=UPI0020B1DE49|nr:DEP domain-containing protein 7 isoform X2 [Brienomyrus brachyistius]
MASVREKAAALSFSAAFFSPRRRPPDHGMANKPFRATFIWSSIITNLQANVEVKRRRHNLKFHNDCFLGSEAVDVILAHLIQSKFFGDAEIPRAKVVRVCQALMDCKVFEAVGNRGFGKEKKQMTFEDSSCSLYRFLNTQTSTNSHCSSSLQKSVCTTASGRSDESLYSNATPVKTDKSFEELLGNLNLNPNNTAHIMNPELSQPLVNEVWQEQTILRLLQLIELPLLDSLLESKSGPQPQLHSMDSDPDLLHTSNYLDREILKAFSDSQADRWLSAAVNCLEFLPDRLVVEVSCGLPRCSDDTQQCKRLLFDVLAKHYDHPQQPPLLTNRLFDIHTGVADLLVNGKLEQALEALQLCLKLLNERNREELRRLLCFMAAAADPAEVRLHREIENRMAVKRAFSRAVINHKNLAKGKVDLLLLFMLDNHCDLFKIPGSLHKLVSEKLASLLQGKDTDSVTGSAFCQRVSSKTYTENVQKTTKEELWALLRTIHENPMHSTKEKKRLLGQFYKGHPQIFMQYFEITSSAVNV